MKKHNHMRAIGAKGKNWIYKCPLCGKIIRGGRHDGKVRGAFGGKV